MRIAPLLFLSTLSLRRATYYWRDAGNRQHISIHALLAESDVAVYAASVAYANFYPRSPCGERLRTMQVLTCTHQFLSTLSLRRATSIGKDGNKYFVISIHALLAESDNCPGAAGLRKMRFLSTLSLRRATSWSACRIRRAILFLSTLSLRRATMLGQVAGLIPSISIHALLAESDIAYDSGHSSGRYISIHALLAESDYSSSVNTVFYVLSFLSTLSLRRATPAELKLKKLYRNFYPRSPCGERRYC